MNASEHKPPADEGRLERMVGRPVPERYARPPCLQCGAMTADEATSRCMGTRADGGCHGTDLFADAE
jgi:hypothetical protein